MRNDERKDDDGDGDDCCVRSYNRHAAFNAWTGAIEYVYSSHYSIRSVRWNDNDDSNFMKCLFLF